MNTSSKPYNLKYYIAKLQTEEKQKKLAEKLKSLCPLEREHTIKKMSSGSDRVPLVDLHYYMRLGSILKRLIHNPCGVKKISTFYKRKKGSSVKPPSMKTMYKSLVRVMLKKLEEQKLIAKNTEGYYTEKKGKDLILSIYEDTQK